MHDLSESKGFTDFKGFKVFKISPFSLTIILSLMHNLFESNGFIVSQNILLSIISFTL